MNSAYPTTRAGAKMRPAIRSRLIEILTDPAYDGLSQKEVAALAGVAVRTVRNYLTPEVWEDIRKLRLDVMARSLAMVDRAIFVKAMNGDIPAAKLIYGRWDDAKHNLQHSKPWLTQLGNIDDELKTLREEIYSIEHTTSPPQTKRTDASSTKENTADTGPGA